jgi:TrmH family RNA methyltransferase
MIQTITSPTNPLIKSVVRLHKASEREETGLCIIEGEKTIKTALTSMTLEKLFCVAESYKSAEEIIDKARILLVSPEILKKMSASTTPSGMLGIFRIPSEPSADKLGPGVVLAQIQDPGNMGTLMRTASACGIKTVVIIEGADPWSSKVIQASAGTIALVQIFRWSWKDLMRFKKNLQLYALVVKGGEHPSKVDATHALLVVGNEARGIESSWLQDCEHTITLPMESSVESLNAAVAGSLALYLTFAYKNILP